MAETWLRVATEGQNFYIPSNQTIRYGFKDQWITKTLTGGVVCSSAFFGGDPAPGIAKVCEILTTSDPTPTEIWLRIADEGQRFSIPSPQTVRYGANDKWVTKTLSGTIDATSAFFGVDPAPNIVKACYLLAVDLAAPTVSVFQAPSTSISLVIPITAFKASDNVAVGGYLLTNSSTPPAANNPGWTLLPPAAITVAAQGSYTLYPWVKDTMGNISSVFEIPVTVIVDFTIPTVLTFQAPVTCPRLEIPISEFTASDNVAVTGYLINITGKQPSANDPGWTPTAPTTFTVPAAGIYLLYPWVKDKSGNVSAVFTKNPCVTADATAPLVKNFTAAVIPNSPAASVQITAYDNMRVAGYLITTSATPPAANTSGWASVPPTVFPVKTSGAYTLYPWVKDSVGNISSVYPAPVTVYIDPEAPRVTSFVAPRDSTSLVVPITDFKAADNVAVTGYAITLSPTPPPANWPGWKPTPPTNFALPAPGIFMIGPWVKDAAGNVSFPYPAPIRVTCRPTESIPPQVMEFMVAPMNNGLEIPIQAFRAMDNVAVTGYLVTAKELEVPNRYGTPFPLADDPRWATTPPKSFVAPTYGTFTLFAWAKDAAGNVSPPGRPITVQVVPVNS